MNTLQLASEHGFHPLSLPRVKAAFQIAVVVLTVFLLGFAADKNSDPDPGACGQPSIAVMVANSATPFDICVHDSVTGEEYRGLNPGGTIGNQTQLERIVHSPRLTPTKL